MKIRLTSIALVTFLVGLAPQTEGSSVGGFCVSAARKLGFATAGVAVTPESAVQHWGSIGLTARSPFFYLNGLQLWTYDFSGKKVLDLGSGRSRFAQFINLFYGDTGAQGHAVDIFWNPLGKYGVRANAAHLPYPDNTFDLVVSNMGLSQFHGYEFYAGLDESLRVLKPGGQLRYTMAFPFFGMASSLRPIIVDHPEVERLSTSYIPFLSFQMPTTVHKKSETDPEKFVQYFEKLESLEGFAVWRPEILDLVEPRDPTTAGRINHVKRKQRRGLSLSDEESQFILRAVSDTSGGMLHRLEAFEYFVGNRIRKGEYDPKFLNLWNTFDADTKSLFMDHLIKGGFSYKSTLNGLGFVKSLPGPFTPQLESRLNRLYQQVERAQRIDLNRRMGRLR